MRHYIVSLKHDITIKQNWIANIKTIDITSFIVKHKKLPTLEEAIRIGINNSLVNPKCVAISEISPTTAEYNDIKVIQL